MKKLGGDGQANGFMTPSPGAAGARARAVRRVQSDTSALEQQIAELTQTVSLLANQNQKVARKAKKPPEPKSQDSSEEEESGSGYEESSDGSCDPHKNRPLPPTSVTGSSPSRRSKKNGSQTSSKGGKPKAIRMLCFNAKIEVQRSKGYTSEDMRTN